MKKRAALLAILFAALIFLLPVLAGQEIGQIYDETGVLAVDALEQLGTQTLPELVNDLELDLRVDILTGLGDYESVEEAAAGRYSVGRYGWGTKRVGALLMILVEPDDESYRMCDWCVYIVDPSGSHSDLFGDALRRDLASCLSEEAWLDDLAQDREALTRTVEIMAEDAWIYVKTDAELASGLAGWSLRKSVTTALLIAFLPTVILTVLLGRLMRTKFLPAPRRPYIETGRSLILRKIDKYTHTVEEMKKRKLLYKKYKHY